jgi:pyrroline-5-carboxylate reductase
MRLAFLGAGKMATAIARGLGRSGIVAPGEMCACDVSEEARAAFTRATGVVCAGHPGESFKVADCVLLAVKPQKVAEAVESLPKLGGEVLIISIAAGVPLARLQDWFGTGRVIRVMPNTPLLVGQGATVYARGSGAGDADAAACEQIFGGLGSVQEVPEGWINAVTALSGSGPAYIFEMVQALTDAGIAVGLPAELALGLTVQTVAGAAEMLRQKQGTPDELRRAVTSPGGTTAAGLAVLEAGGFRPLIRRTVEAARDRADVLGRQGG